MAQKFLSIKNFEKYQHYKHRNPPWIKLHLELLDDVDFLRMPDASKWHYVGLLLLASRHENNIQADKDYIKNRLGLTTDLDVNARFIRGHVLASKASKTLPTKLNLGGSETEAEERQSRVESADAPPAKVVPLSRASGFPDGFQFNQRAEEMAKGYGLNVHKEFAAFRDHHVAKGSVFKDWDAAFRTWLRNAVKFAAKVAR